MAFKTFVDNVVLSAADLNYYLVGSARGDKQTRIVFDNTVAVTDAGGLVTITYPQPFPEKVECVLVTPGDFATPFAQYRLDVAFQTVPGGLSSFTVACYNQVGVLIATGAVRLWWLAIGY